MGTPYGTLNSTALALQECCHEQRVNYDSAWKQALEGYFPDFMAFFWQRAQPIRHGCHGAPEGAGYGTTRPSAKPGSCGWPGGCINWATTARK